MLPFDLHVLGLPPAFTLSQDQTLHLSIATQLHAFDGVWPCLCFECSVVPSPNYSITRILRCLFLIHLDCVEHLRMDNHPPARRPHKSPAHTVKDRWNRPQRRVPTRHQSARVSRTSYSRFRGRQHLVNRVRTPCRTPPTHRFRPGGPRIMHTPSASGKGEGKKDLAAPPACSASDQPHPGERALTHCEHTLETGLQHALGILHHLAVDPHRALLELSVGLGVARSQPGRGQ